MSFSCLESVGSAPAEIQSEGHCHGGNVFINQTNKSNSPQQVQALATTASTTTFSYRKIKRKENNSKM